MAPTPTSALLHSATMVKAGVYLLIRLAPAMEGNLAGLMVTTIGGFTFLVTSMLAISQDDGKKVLAYSTLSNLGLITACAGVGMHEAVWAAILLMMFHAVSKSLMFLSVGAVENCTGSRNIEDMHGLIVKLPGLAYVMIIGIAGMFLAPFGMLISKWAALKAYVDSGSILLVIFLVFGSATTLFYWTKWLGTLVAVHHHSERLNNVTKKSEWKMCIRDRFRIDEGRESFDGIMDFLMDMITGKDVNARENAMRAFYAIGNESAILAIWRKLEDNEISHSRKLLADGLLSFQGDRKELAKLLFAHREEFGTTLFLPVMQFIRFFTGDFQQQFFTLLSGKNEDKEIQLEAIRYFRRYPYEPVREILQNYVRYQEYICLLYTSRCV